MKNPRTLGCLLIVAAMLLSLLAGCGQSGAGSAASDTHSESAAVSAETPVAQEAAQENTAETPDPESNANASVPEAAGPEAYYACDKTTEITVLFQFPAFFQSFFPTGWNSSDFWTEFGSKTNTVWTLQEVANLAWQENVNLLCASGDLPDVVTNLGSVYSSGNAAAIRDEMIIDIAPDIAEYAPHYFESLQRDEYSLKTTLTNDGQMGAMYALLEEPYPITSGLWIRQDWLDGLGKDAPTTTDELKDTLIAFRDSYGADIGLYQMIRANTGNAAFSVEGVWNAFGPCNFYYDTKENAVAYGPMQDYYYEYLTYLKELVQEGLFATSDMTDLTDEELVRYVGIQGDMPDNIKTHEQMMGDANAKLTPMAAIGAPTEYAPISSLISTDAGGNISISTNCEEPAVVLKALDYLFTDEGAMLSSYGIEGQTYEIGDDRKPALTELVTNNPDGIPARAAMGYFLNPGIPGLIDYARSQTAWDETQKSAYDVWASAYTGSSMTIDIDTLTLTQEEQDAIATYKSDMVTYVTEWANSIVFGDADATAAEIQSFRSTMEDTMHISDILEIYNDAYSRFQNRTMEQ